MAEPVTLLLIAINVAHSLYAFRFLRSPEQDRFLFAPARVRRGRGFEGIWRSSFSHADQGHLLFNMITLFFFGPVVEIGLGWWALLLTYVASEVGATLLTFVNHLHDDDYRSLGASGAVSGVLFAAIVLAPEMSIFVFLIPVPIPAPLFAVLYLAYSFWAARRQLGNIGHEAHIGGAATGMLLAGALSPEGFTALGRALGGALSF